MQLGCTPKLQEFLKKDILLADQSMDPFYIWNASIMLVKRRKTIVVLHAQSRCGFVLHGITVRDIRELDHLILDGIRGMLAAHGICAAVIDQYLDECGRILYTTTQDQQAVAHLNYFCEQVGFFSEAFIAIKQFQTHLLQSLNEDLVKFDEEYADPRQKLRDSFSEHYPGQSVFFQKMAVLDIKLMDSPYFRRLCIPSHYSLMKLHWAIQILFSWKDAHLHVFETEDGLSLDFDFPEYSFLVSEDDWEQPVEAEMERYLSIGEVFAHSRTIQYIYDPERHWLHRITLAAWKDDAQNSPASCTLASGMAPAEDVSVPDGYAKRYNAVKASRHEKTNNFQQWLDSVCDTGPNLPTINKTLGRM